jgi:hypothetical protein
MGSNVWEIGSDGVNRTGLTHDEVKWWEQMFTVPIPWIL